MTRIALALLLVAAPAFAQYGRDDRPPPPDWSGSWDDGDQYDWAQSDGSEGDWDAWEDTAPADEGTYAQDRGPTFDDFRGDRELSWYGDWVETPEYGTVWRPTHVRDEWQPYLYGRWVWTNAGWAWASDEPFGWAVYHYGRWAWSPAMGWMWVPGRVWAPAWVAWRWTDGYAAWCPLGPRSVVYVDRPALWVIVPSRHFLEPVRHYVIPRRQRYSLPLPPRPCPRAGPAVTVVERVIGRTVRPLPIGNAGSPSSARAGSSSVDFYRPRPGPVATHPRAVPPSGIQAPRVVAPAPGQPGRPVPQAPRAGRPVYSAPPSAPARPPPTVTAPTVRPPQAQPGERVVAPTVRPPQAQPGQRVVAPRFPAPQANPGNAPGARPPHPGNAPAAQAPAAQPQPGNAPTPHASAPIPRSSPEQPQAKER